MKIKVRDGLEIGDGCPVFIVAEVGSNWATLEDCITSISQAKLCGADAVKFQAFNHEALYGWVKFKDCLTGSEMAVLPGELPLEWLPKLKEKCDAVGIEFMCSAFSPELLDAVNPFVNVHKLASAEMNHKRMLEKLREYGKPVIMSTGAASVADIRASLAELRGIQGTDVNLPPGLTITPTPCPIVLMYCVAAYPATEINLGVIPLMRRTFGVHIGFSDHSIDVGVIPLAAQRVGAGVIEKHFTAVPELNTPDRGHSLTPSQFKNMVGILRGEYNTRIGPNAEEQVMITRHKRRLIATKDIEVGQAFIEGENFGIYRSLKDEAKALHPFAVDSVNGKIAKNRINAGDGIGPGDI